LLNRDAIPSITFYDQDFVDLYDRSWVKIDEQWTAGTPENGFQGSYLSYPDQKYFHQFDACISSLFLNYSNLEYSPYTMVDYFYSKQEPSGAIRSEYSIVDGSPLLSADNPEGITLPLFAYVEFLFYHKVGNKKRLKEVVPILEKYFQWITTTFQKENGLCNVPVAACNTGNIPRQNVYYPVDFNSMIAMNALYMSMIGDILNDKELSFRFKRMYFSYKTRISNMMWDPDKHFYFDLDANGNRTDLVHIGGFWTMLAEIPNDERASYLIAMLKDPKVFGTDNPFPCLPADSPYFSSDGNGFCGAVLPVYTYLVIKGLEKYGEFIFAREAAIRNLYFILDTLSPEEGKTGEMWEAYLPDKEGAPQFSDEIGFPRRRLLSGVCIVSITLMIENIIGFDISLPRKTVYWTVPDLETMGISDLSLKKNMITIQSSRNARGWEIRLESEKLYYFTIEILNEHKKKTLPIPSGKCSMLIDKL